MPKLLIKTGEKKGFSCQLSTGEITIGRDPLNNIVLPDRRVSRHHARISSHGEEYVVEDIGSVNGTFVNNDEIKKQTLKLGDELKVGSTVISFLSVSDSGEMRHDESRPRVKLVREEEAPSGITIEMTVDPKKLKVIKPEFDKSDVATIEKAYKRLMILYRVSHDLSAVVELPKLLDKMLELAIEIMNADRGFVMFLDEETGDLSLQSSCTKEGASQDEEIAFSKTIAQQVIKTGESVLTSDALKDDRFKNAESIVAHGIRATMCVPIKFKEEILGIMNLDSMGTTVSFTKDDLELLTAISNQAAAAIENAKLFEGLKKANVELKDQQAQLIEAEKLSAVGQLASGVAHEINNPMTSILGYSSLSLKRLSEGRTSEKDFKEYQEFLQIIEDEANRCQHIVKSLLQFSRRQKGDMAQVQVNDVVEAALTISRFHIKGTRIEVKNELATNLPKVNADANQLQQVFLNMIVNAKDAMEKGGTLTISTKQEDKFVVTRFADTGCGVPEDKMDEIFKPLYTSKEEGKGTGLGLSISHDIVERHGGVIEVESQLNKGTTFIIKLPL